MTDLTVDMAHLTSYMAMQQKEILEHKYYLSQRIGKDVGMHEAIEDWNEYHLQRFHDAFYENKDDIDRICQRVCNFECRGIVGCVLSNRTLHEILGDD